MAEQGVQKRYAFYTAREWRIAALVLVSFIGFYILRDKFLQGIDIRATYAIGLAAIFFASERLLPAIFISAAVAGIFMGEAAMDIGISAASVTFVAGIGGYLLRRRHIDPILRRDRDTLGLLAILAAVSFVPAALVGLGVVAAHAAEPAREALYRYISSFFSLVIMTPFLLRWCAKPRFSRTWNEILEIASAFLLLALICIMYFVEHVESLFGIPFFYYLLLPFFFIALRLRPRFVTLALFCMAVFAVYSFMPLVGESGARNDMYHMELYLSVVACNFLIIGALEEHRRANASRLLSQVSVLENAVARISSESRAKNDFIAILAHELRNPLTPVLSGIELLKLKKGGTEETEVLSSMSQSMRTVKSLLNDLLDVSRISEGKISLDKRVMDVEPALASAIQSTEHHRKERHQRLAFKSSTKPLKIYGDPVRIEQIFSNLLTNASKYSNEGDTVTLHARARDGFAEIEVTDKGIGIEPEQLDGIFEAFQQVEHGERTKEGLGIGLSLVRDFVHMHGGTVRAESAGRGKGSRFVVRLPLAARKKA